MDMFKFARAQEIRAEQTYRDCATHATDPSLKEVFTLLADAEKNHLAIIQQLERQNPSRVATSVLLERSRDLLQRLAPDKPALRAAQSRVDVYQEAQRQEKEARTFYQEKAQEAADPVTREIFLALANQEHEHFQVLDWLIDLIRTPDLENAEFNRR